MSAANTPSQYMFERFSIETSSYCNRRCVTCLRQRHEDRRAVAPWFVQNLMPTETVKDLLGQVAAIEFSGMVILSYYNEATLDERLPEFGRYAMDLGLRRVLFATNGDTMCEDLARKLDGNFHKISISLYEDNSVERQNWMRSLFTKTQLKFSHGMHFLLAPAQVGEYSQFRCFNVSRNVAINHRGDFLACCQEMVPHYNFGSIYEESVMALWKKKEDMIRTLRTRGGREKYAYCAVCSYGAKKEFVKVVPK